MPQPAHPGASSGQEGGLTEHQARSRGLDTAATESGPADAIVRPWTYERDPRGMLGLLADRRVLAGAWAVAPLASEWIHQAALAIRTQIPIDVLLGQVAQYPTRSEAHLAARTTRPVKPPHAQPSPGYCCD